VRALKQAGGIILVQELPGARVEHQPRGDPDRVIRSSFPGEKTMITRLKKSATKVNRIGSAEAKRSTRDDSVEVRSRRILATILALRDGNFSVRLPSDWDGIDGQIATALNQALSYENRLSREIERLSRTVGR
jgi:hypothetical protein